MSLPDFDFNQYVVEICKGIKSRPKREEVMEELLGHLEDNFERNLAVGMTEEEARIDAINKMGDGATLAYRLSVVHSYSPLKAMSSAFFALIAGHIAMNFFIKGIVNDVLFLFGIAFMFSPLLRMRKMNAGTQKAFHFFNFYVIARLALYCLKLGRILPVYFECAFVAVIFALEGFFWFFLFTGLYKFCQPYLKEDGKTPHLYFCGVYHLLLSFFSGFLLVLSEGEEVDLPAFILPYFMIFMYFYGTFQLIRMRNVLWDADGEYGILPSDKKNMLIYASALLFCLVTAIGFHYVSATKEPVKTELIIHDLSQEEQTKADKIRKKMVDWGVHSQVVEDLPDSEILRYKDTEFVSWGADGGNMGGTTYNTGTSNTVNYYWFFIPEKEHEGSYIVRLLCYIESDYEDRKKSFYRKGFYYCPWQNGIFPLNLEDEINGSFISIVTEERGKKYNAEPFFTYKFTDEYITEYPKGFEYREEKGQRVYYATQLGVTYPEEDGAGIYAATVRQKNFFTFNYNTTADFIRTVMNGVTVKVSSNVTVETFPYVYRLHDIRT